MHGVFNPNIPIFPPNFAEGLHFSAFHYIIRIAVGLNLEENRWLFNYCETSLSGFLLLKSFSNNNNV